MAHVVNNIFIDMKINVENGSSIFQDKLWLLFTWCVLNKYCLHEHIFTPPIV